MQQFELGSLHLTTRKITGHFSPRSAPQVALMSESMRAHMTGLSSVPQFPRTLPLPVSFVCPQGHYRASTDFSFLQFSKAMWCSQCSAAHT
eukprot:936616-Karenia_brevis.AAC.1